MASASSFPCEEQLLCSICLGDFTEPVSTPCGHNYCKSCITGYWASRDLKQCPLCMKKFHSIPKLQVNTEFRDMVEHFNNMRVKSTAEIRAKPGEVACDICLEQKLKAEKTCLVCLASYCRSHLEPHHRVTTLKKHKLIDPVLNLEERLCKKHDKVFELFCCLDQTYVCFMCLKDDHVMHETIPLEHMFMKRKAQLEIAQIDMTLMENMKVNRIQEIKDSVEQSKKELEKEIAIIDEAFFALVASLQKSQIELVELIQEQQKLAEKQAKDQVTQLELEVSELKRRRLKMEELLQTDDDFCLLQIWPPPSFPGQNTDLSQPMSCPTPPIIQDLLQQSYVGMVKQTVIEIAKSLSKEMKNLFHEVKNPYVFPGDKQPDAAEKLTTDEFGNLGVWNPPQDRLMMIQQHHAVDVTLDPYTANSRVIVSDKGKRLSFNQGHLYFNSIFGRTFEYQSFVLGKDGFSSGRFYFEVRVSESSGWVLGVVKESVNKDQFFFPTPEEGCWAFGGIVTSIHEVYFSNIINFSCGPVYLEKTPQTVGVFVDYENEEVSFYDADTRTLIYSFTACGFSETTPALKAFSFSLLNTPQSRPKLFPIFGIFGDDPNNVLIIPPVGGAAEGATCIRRH